MEENKLKIEKLNIENQKLKEDFKNIVEEL